MISFSLHTLILTRKKLSRSIVMVLLILSFLQSLVPFSANALSFNPENIVSDRDFFNTQEMTRDDVQTFLEQKGSALAHYSTTDASGSVKSAADIIWNAAVHYGINPKVILVLLQKEQSLIENPNPTQYNLDWATGFAICDSCSPTDPALAPYKGFGTQVEKAAWKSKSYAKNPYSFSFQKGISGTVDSIPITPLNTATAALYNYTPHISGNFSFWKIWMKYFGKQYPDGMIALEQGSQTIWLIQGGMKRAFVSMSAFLTRYQPNTIVTIGPSDLANYPEGAPIRFPQYSLLKIPSGAVFLIVGDGKYAIPSQKIFKAIGFNPEEIIPVQTHDISDIPTIGLLSAPSISPVATLLQDKTSGGIYYVMQGIKHPLLERAILAANFSYMNVQRASPTQLAAYATGDPVLFKDGTLVKRADSPIVYMISNGEKRPFASQDAFKTLGFQWTEIVTSNGSTLDNIPIGRPIDLGQDVDQNISSPVTSATIQ